MVRMLQQILTLLSFSTKSAFHVKIHVSDSIAHKPKFINTAPRNGRQPAPLLQCMDRSFFFWFRMCGKLARFGINNLTCQAATISSGIKKIKQNTFRASRAKVQWQERQNHACKSLLLCLGRKQRTSSMASLGLLHIHLL